MSTLKTNAITTVAGKPILNSTGSILQVIQTVKTDIFSTSTNANGGVPIPGLSATITPSNANNKILICGSFCITSSPGYSAGVSLYRGATLIGAGDRTSDVSTPLQQRVSTYVYIYGVEGYGSVVPVPLQYLDSPGTTSATTYSLNIHNDGRSSTVVVGNLNETNNTYVLKPLSYIMLMEVSG